MKSATESFVLLKPGKEKPLLNRHHWIFSGAIARLPEIENGELVQVRSHAGEILGTAYFNRHSSITGRMISFGEEDPYQFIETSLVRAIALRKSLICDSTTAYRLVNGEGDSIPGLIVDRYGDVLVVQISTLGMEKLKSLLLDLLQGLLKPKGIFEKSNLPSRKEEGLPSFSKLLMGEMTLPLRVLEEGLLFEVNPQEGQKTGFFLDQRKMRAYIRSLADKKRVLNCFCYTGGFSVYALAGGASLVDSVDISSEAIQGAKKNCLLNGFHEGSQLRFFDQDVFEFLRSRELNYDLVILDPPAFAKRAKDVIAACRGYKEINREALAKMPSGSILMTSSCSHHVDEKLFQQVIFQAAVDAGRSVKIIGSHQQAEDHPVNLFHPEGAYLKTLILYVE